MGGPKVMLNIQRIFRYAEGRELLGEIAEGD